jgi:ribose transport system substrate-binding protein
MRRRIFAPRYRFRPAAGVVAVALVALVALLAACGSGSSSSAGSSSPAASSPTSSASGTTPASTASTVPLSAIPSSVAANYTGYQSFSKLYTDAYANWTVPKAPWKFCFSIPDVNNSWAVGTQTELTALYKQLLAAKLAKPGFTTDISNDNTALQISQTDSLVSSGCNVILSVPGSPTALCAAIANAFNHGVLYVTDDTPIYCPQSINVSLNVYETMYVAAQAVVKAMQGKGNLLVESGIAGAVDTAVKDSAVAAVVKANPGVTSLGQVVGDFSSSVAQTGTAQFLGTHPQTVNGIVDLGGMGVAGELALQQAGRPQADVNFYEASCSEVAYQHEHPSAVAMDEDQGPGPAAYETMAIALRMLYGQRPITSTLFYPIPGPTATSVDQWFKPSMTIKSTCFAAPPSGRIIPDSYFNPLFKGGKQVSVQLNP